MIEGQDRKNRTYFSQQLVFLIHYIWQFRGDFGNFGNWDLMWGCPSKNDYPFGHPTLLQDINPPGAQSKKKKNRQ